eukprot:gene48530-37771_t
MRPLIELLRSCDVLLCDEPTSGLDNNSAETIVATLKGVAEGRHDGTPRCVVCTIHQPSTRVLMHFSHLVLLVGGE